MIAADDNGFFWATWFTEQMRQDAYEAGEDLASVNRLWPRAYVLTPPVIPEQGLNLP